MKNVLVARESNEREYYGYYPARENPTYLTDNSVYTLMMELEDANYASVSAKPIAEKSKFYLSDKIGELAVKFRLLPVYGKGSFETEFNFEEGLITSIKPEYIVLIDGKYIDEGLDWLRVKGGYIRGSDSEAGTQVARLNTLIRDYSVGSVAA